MPMASYTDQSDGIFQSVCPLDCPDQCGLRIHKKGGKVSKIEGDPDHPVTKGNICNKVRKFGHRLNDPNRLRYPMKRVGPKGKGQFERISWEEALLTITEKWKHLIDEHGPESILPYSFYGNMGRLSSEGMDRRFFHRLGASILDQTICNSAGGVGYNYTMGSSIGTNPEDTIHANLFIFWGINAVSTNMHQVALAQKARREHGAKIIVIDVHKNQTGRWADWFIPILPGTDTALALGLMHVLFKENLVDAPFLESSTIGHEELKEHVKHYNPAWASSITGIPEATIYELARVYGTTSPAFIRIGNGLQHHDQGGMAVRTIACLPALTGQWLHKGGGALKGNSAILEFNTKALQLPSLRRNPQTRHINMNQIGEALLTLDPPILSLFVFNCNPAVVAPEINKVKKGLIREDLFTVVHDLFLTETAQLADIVLPATSSFENLDFYTSYWHHYIQLQQPIIKPFYESKSNTDVFRLLAEKMGFQDSSLFDDDPSLIMQALEVPSGSPLSGITLEQLKEETYIKGRRHALFETPLKTPSGKIELYSKRMAQDGFPPLPTYKPFLKETEHPYHFVPGPNHLFLNTTFSHQSVHQKLEKRPILFINERDAKKEGILDGDWVKIWNERGECELIAAVGTDVLSGVLVTQGLWADLPGTKQLVNRLTPDRLADMGGGATFFSGRVSLTKRMN